MFKKIFSLIICLVFFTGMVLAKEKEKRENFKLRLDYGLNNSFILDQFDSEDFSLVTMSEFKNYLGNWWFLWWFPDGYVGGVFTQTSTFPYEQGDSVPLLQTREVTLNEIGNRLGFGTELRLIENLWLTLNYYRPGTKTINSVENEETMKFVKLHCEGHGQGFYKDYSYYTMQLSRTFTIQKSTYELYARNYQLGFKYLFGTKKLSFGILAGIDLWQVYQDTATETKIYSVLPWKGIVQDNPKETKDKKSEIASRIRGYFGVEVEVLIFKNLKLALTGKKYFGNNNQFEFQNDFLMEVRNFWRIEIPHYSISTSLIFSF